MLKLAKTPEFNVFFGWFFILSSALWMCVCGSNDFNHATMVAGGCCGVVGHFRLGMLAGADKFNPTWRFATAYIACYAALIAMCFASALTQAT